jgi:FkbM family methyltransferase
MFRMLKTCVKSVLHQRQKFIEDECAHDVHQLLDGEILHMVDVGASGGILPRWRPCQSDLAFIGLEPDSRSFDELSRSDEAKRFADYRLIPLGAWDSDRKLAISFTRKPMCSSHFQPNTSFLSRFPEAERFDIIATDEVHCQALDTSLADFGTQVDFIKLDLEGGELAVLGGANRVLATTLGLHVEVCFQRLRVGQPLFGQITDFLDQRGLEFIDFVTIMRWERDHYRGFGQAVAADALYLRSPEGVIELVKNGALDIGKLKRYLATLAIYGRCDLAARTLELATAANLLADEQYLRLARNIFARKQTILSKRARLLARLSYVYSRWTNPSSSLHYIY